MNQTTNRPRIAAFCIGMALALAAQAEIAPTPVYSNGFSMTIRLGRELTEALPANFSEQLDPHVITLQTQDLPLVAPVVVTEENHVYRQVSLSTGFIDLVNHLSHAKAINNMQPGYFEQYVKNLALLCASDATTQAPNIVEDRYWTDAVMNDQISYFNQMISLAMAINLSHHYLGHYAKYGAKLATASDKPVPINNFLNSLEWEASVKAGTANALNCGLSTEGIRALFTAIDVMPRRPIWTAYILPQNVDIKALNKELEHYEDEFFHGHLK
jgi:hypothetical protein